MASLIQKNFRARKSFAKLKQVIDIPNLIDIQKRSYDKFLQIDIPIEKREDIGLQGVFKSVFPIKDFIETARSSLSRTTSRSRSTTSTSAARAA